MASPQEEHEGTGEVPKPPRAVRRSSTEGTPGRSGVSGVVWGSRGWLVSPERGGCEILSGPWWARQGLGAVMVSEHRGEMFVMFSPETELVFLGFVCLPTFSLSLCCCVAHSLGCCTSQCKIRIFVCTGRISEFWS